MFDEKTRLTRELVGLRRKHDDVQFHVGEILPTHLETVRIVSVIEFATRSRRGNPFLESVQRLVIVVSLSRGIVVGGHSDWFAFRVAVWRRQFPILYPENQTHSDICTDFVSRRGILTSREVRGVPWTS